MKKKGFRISLFVLLIFIIGLIINEYSEKRNYIQAREKMYDELKEMFADNKNDFETVVEELNNVEKIKEENYIIQKDEARGNTDWKYIYFEKNNFKCSSDEEIQALLNDNVKLKDSLNKLIDAGIVEHIGLYEVDSEFKIDFCINKENMSFDGMYCYIWYCDYGENDDIEYKTIDDNWYVYIPEHE